MKTVKYLLQTFSILIAILILLGAIILLLQDADFLYEMSIIRQLKLETKEISLGILKYTIVASSIAIAYLLILLAFNNKIMYILAIVFSVLSFNYVGVGAGIVGIILANKEKKDPSSIVNYDLKIGGANLALFIIQFVITLPVAIVLLFLTFKGDIKINPWLYFLIIPLFLMLIYVCLLLISLEVVFLTIAGLFSKQRWIFRISMIGSFATLQIFSGIAAMRVINQNK